MEATTEFHKKVSIEQSSFCLEQDTVMCHAAWYSCLALQS